jgi:hypothetical protein
MKLRKQRVESLGWMCKMRKLISILFICLWVLANSSFVNSKEVEFEKSFVLKKFKKIPKEFDDGNWGNLIQKIIPSKKYKYWECRRYEDFIPNKIIAKSGDTSQQQKIKAINCNSGFFRQCLPGSCFQFIIAINQNDSIEVIDREEKLRGFIGEIDNLEEALLVAKSYGYWFDKNNKIGGAYRILDGDYYLYLLSYSQTPVTYTSIKVILKKNGQLKLVDSKVYKKTNEFYIN